MCLGAVNVDGSLLCNCHMPANGSKVETLATSEQQAAKASEALVDELLRTAVAATAEAPNRAVKRRVRQRLHKKLGAVLNKQEFDVAMERFHTAAEAQRVHHDEADRTQRRGPVNRAPIGTAPTRPAQTAPSQVVAVPVWMVQPVGAPVAGPAPAAARMGQVQMQQMPQQMPQQMQPQWNCGMTVCAVQDVRQFQERVQVPEMASAPFKAPMQYVNNAYFQPQDELDLAPNQGFSFQRAMSEGAGYDSMQSTGQAANLPVQRTFIQFSNQDGSQRRSRSQ